LAELARSIRCCARRHHDRALGGASLGRSATELWRQAHERIHPAFAMTTVQVRYIVRDVDAAITFYVNRLDVRLDMHPAPAFAMLSFGDLRLVLSAPNPTSGGGQPMPDGIQQEPGGWNRFAIQVSNLPAVVERLRTTGAHFRSTIVAGVGGKQIIVDDPRPGSYHGQLVSS
jgi:catechol 2,3-dioxygenase-like lactoylglutathione lyase family enzyme